MTDSSDDPRRSVFSAAELAAACSIVYAAMPPTPQYRWPLLSDLLAAKVWVKHENHTPTGAFKVRGGLVYAARVRRAEPGVRGLIAATRGNHGQSVAFAGRAQNLPVTVVVPHGNSPDKNRAMIGFGADLIEHGSDFQDALEYAAGIAGPRGLHFVPSYHPDLVLGVASYAKELFDAAGALDAVYVGIGLGSGICGLIGVRDLLGLDTEIIGVVAEKAPALALSFAAGRPISTERADTFADGVACRVPNADVIPPLVSGAARVVQVSEDAVAEAVRVFLRTTHNLAEPAGAIALAGAIAEQDLVTGRRVGVILSGGNLDLTLLEPILAGHTPTV